MKNRSTIQLWGILMSMLFLCGSIQNARAQVTWPWALMGGHGGEDFLTDLAQTTDGNYIACISGGETDTISFMVIKVSQSGLILWQTEIDKDAFEERPLDISFTSDGDFVYVTGYANSTKNIWVVELSVANGTVIGTSDDWSDATPANSGNIAFGHFGVADSMNILFYNSGLVNFYKLSYIDTLATIVSYTLPQPPFSVIEAISDVQDFSVGYTSITGTLTASMVPYIWIFHQTDSVKYFELPRTGVNAKAISAGDDEFFEITGTTIDTDGVYFASFDTIGGFLHFNFDTIYNDGSGYLEGTDVKRLEDGSFLIIKNGETAFGGLATILMHIDVTGDIISQDTLLPNIGIDLLPDFAKYENGPALTIGGEIFGGIDEDEYLIVRTDTDQVFPDCAFGCIWPGDADNNSVVDMADLFPIGAGFGLTGPERLIPTDVWKGYYGDEWPVFLTGTLNAKYADCHGNGEISFEDTTSIMLNYSLDHPVNTLRLGETDDIPIWLNTAGVVLHSGYNEIPIMLGTEAIPVDSIYGVEFSISYEGPDVIDSSSVHIQFNDSWMGDDTSFLQLDYNFPFAHSVDAGVVRMELDNKSGYGEIGKLGFIVEDNIAGIMVDAGDSSMIFNIDGPTGVLNDLTPVYISGSAYEVNITSDIVDWVVDNSILYPNPSNGGDIYIFNSIQLFNDYTIYNVSGQEMYSGKLLNNTIQLSEIPGLNSGTYFLRLTGDNYTTTKKLIIISSNK